MRLIGTLSSETEAHRLSVYLKSKGMESSCEPLFDPQTGHVDYQVWIHDEDKIGRAEQIFQKFQQNPKDPEFNVAVQPPVSPRVVVQVSRTFSTHFTTFIIALCTFIFLLSTLEEMPLMEEGVGVAEQVPTPIEALFLYDLPPSIAHLIQVVQKYEAEPQKQLPGEVKAELEKAASAPYWHGIYDWVVLKIKGKSTKPAEGPMFQKIREGQVWRLITPVLLHYNLLHILFNMIWVWVLGRQIEVRIGPLRSLILALVMGIGSNTVQYLMSGPLFLGYSGIIMGLAGFIWMRERLAPWEGYPLNRATMLFIALFIGGIFVLQLVTFFIQIFTHFSFQPNIANSAHISGAVIGAMLARLHYFARIRT